MAVSPTIASSSSPLYEISYGTSHRISGPPKRKKKIEFYFLSYHSIGFSRPPPTTLSCERCTSYSEIMRYAMAHTQPPNCVMSSTISSRNNAWNHYTWSSRESQPLKSEKRRWRYIETRTQRSRLWYHLSCGTKQIPRRGTRPIGFDRGYPTTNVATEELLYFMTSPMNLSDSDDGYLPLTPGQNVFVVYSPTHPFTSPSPLHPNLPSSSPVLVHITSLLTSRRVLSPAKMFPFRWC